MSLFDRSMTESELILSLRYLDESRPVLKIDDPMKVKSQNQRIELFAFSDGRGYRMDYDLTTNGEINDLTLQIEFLKKGTDILFHLMICIRYKYFQQGNFRFIGEEEIHPLLVKLYGWLQFSNSMIRNRGMIQWDMRVF